LSVKILFNKKRIKMTIGNAKDLTISRLDEIGIFLTKCGVI
jgi:hypothetical protein